MKKRDRLPRKTGSAMRLGPRRKMSEIIVEISEPWFERLAPRPPLHTFRLVYECATLIWNVSRLPDLAQHSASMAALIAASEKTLGTIPALETSEVMGAIYQKAMMIGRWETRIVVDFEVSTLPDGQVHLLVLTAG